jgi:hypothetical protein
LKKKRKNKTYFLIRTKAKNTKKLIGGKKIKLALKKLDLMIRRGCTK